MQGFFHDDYRKSSRHGGSSMATVNELLSLRASFTLVTATAPKTCSKSYSLSAAGKLEKTTIANVSRGTVKTRSVSSLSEFAHVLKNLQHNQALVYGVPRHPAAHQLVTDEAWQRAGRPAHQVARTAEALRWPEGAGVMFLDYDPADAATALTRDELLSALYQACPCLQSVEKIWFPSSSSHIVHSSTGQDFTGLRGQRIYMLVQDASDIERAGKALVDRLWLCGFGRFDVSDSGSRLERTLVDATVFQPNRLDFAAGATCTAPLQQQRGEPLLIRGDVAFCDTRSAIQDLSAAELQHVRALKASAKDAQEIVEKASCARAQWQAQKDQASAEKAVPAEKKTQNKPAAKVKTEAIFEQASGLLARLNTEELERAQSLPLFAAPDRLAIKPRCSNSKSHAVFRVASHALTHAYIEPSSPVAYQRIVLDLDWNDERHQYHDRQLRELAEQNAFEQVLSVPAPDWIALSRDKNSAHVGYEIQAPVGRHENARRKPLEYLSAVEVALSLKWGADPEYSGTLCKNPINQKWDFYKCHDSGRDLNELASWLDLTQENVKKFNRQPRGEISRNFYLFDMTRFWAYDNVKRYREHSDYRTWCAAVLAQAQVINCADYQHLPNLKGKGLLKLSECRSIAVSVAKWVWEHHGKTVSAAFSALQSHRGGLGGIASGKARAAASEDKRDSARLMRASGMSYGAIAAELGVSKGIVHKWCNA